MDIEQATAIVTALADGHDPYTGEVLTDPVHQHPQTIRALYVALSGLELKRQRDKRLANMPPRHGTPWTTEEDDRLVEGFEAGKATQELALEHQRTRSGVIARLNKLGRATL